MKTRQRAKTASLPSPVGGLNVSDSLVEMEVKYAVVFENWWPTSTKCMIRKGFLGWATGLPGTVQTLLDYPTLTGVRRLFAATSTGNVYDVTNSGAVGAAVVSGLANGKLQHTIFTNSAGEFLIFVNGVDSMRQYNGSTWSTITTAITGITTADITTISQFKNRLWFAEKNTLNAYYLPTDAITGAAVKFPLSSVFSRGGYLTAIIPWTIDAGAGVDDQLVFISSEGEVLVYKGTDPSSSTTFALVGLYSIANVVGGSRCCVKYMGDIYLLTEYGITPLSDALLSQSISDENTISDKILPAVQTAINYGRLLYGWQIVVFPSASMLLVNVPTPNANYQFAMNTVTGAWTTFTGMDAECFATSGSDLFFGTSGKVCKAWTNYSDNANAIVAKGIQAFSDFGNGAINKQFSLCRPILYTDGIPSILLNINLDYDVITLPTGSLPIAPTINGMVWGSMLWDAMFWGGMLTKNTEWNFAGGIGYTAALSMIVSNNKIEVQWAATDFLFEVGGVL